MSPLLSSSQFVFMLLSPKHSFEVNHSLVKKAIPRPSPHRNLYSPTCDSDFFRKQTGSRRC